MGKTYKLTRYIEEARTEPFSPELDDGDMIEVAAGQRHTVLEIEEVRSCRRSLELLHGEHYDWTRGADRAGDASHRRPLCHVGQTYGHRVSRADTSHTVRNRSPRVDPERRAQLLRDLEELVLAEGFMALSMDDLAHRLHCSKATLYSVAGNKEQLVVALTKGFFRQATEQIEQAVAGVADPRLRIPAYLSGVGRAMSRCSTQFYADMVGLRSTASIYRTNSAAAARRVQELIADGVREGALRSIDGNFAGQLVALAIEGVQSGALLNGGLSAGEAYTEMADLLLHGLSAPQA